MENEFIPYEQALALKELGFDEPCFGHWNYNNGEYQSWCGKKDLEKERTNEYIISVEKDFPKMNKGGCTAPLYQQAFRWFREKYNLDSFVKHLYKSTIKVGYYFGIDEYKGVEFQMDFDVWYNTYEEAELDCLIKLIEIVKTK
jgi:hypothetical protein